MTEITEKLKRIRKALGGELASLMLGTTPNTLAKWIKAQEPPPGLTELVGMVDEILGILAVLGPRETKEWLIDDNEYLYGVPVLEMKKRPKDVYLAAMHRVAKPEGYE
jgi:hypothetical protein